MDAKYDVDTAVFMHCLLPYLSAYLPTATSFPRHKGSLEKNPDCDVWFLKPVYQDHGSSMAIETGTGKTLQLAILRLHMRLEHICHHTTCQSVVKSPQKTCLLLKSEGFGLWQPHCQRISP